MVLVVDNTGNSNLKLDFFWVVLQSNKVKERKKQKQPKLSFKLISQDESFPTWRWVILDHVANRMGTFLD